MAAEAPASPPSDQVIVDIKDYVYHYQVTKSKTKTWARARECLLDSIGCAILAISTSEECRALVGPFVRDTTVQHGFCLPGTQFILDPVKGAFDFGAMIRWQDFNDGLSGLDWGHPSDNLGAIVAVCDWLCRSGQSNITMRTLLEAMIKAYEVQGTFQLTNSFNTKGLDHTVLVKLASTAVVSWLIGLSEEQAMAAISHVFMDGIPLRLFRAGSNCIPRKSWAAGDACMRAVQLALLAREGQPGAPSVLTMPRWGFYSTTWCGESFQLPRPYETYVMETVANKVYPCEGHALPAVEAMLEQCQRLKKRGLDALQDVAAIRVRATKSTVTILDKPWPLYNFADRDHCLRYILCLTLLKGGPPEVQDYRDDSPWALDRDGWMEATKQKIELLEDAGFTAEYRADGRGRPAPPVAGVTVVLRDGQILDEVVIRDGPGTPSHPKTTQAVHDKFRRNMKAGAFSELDTEKIIFMVQDDDLLVSEFVDALRGRMGLSML
ncbi:hypothetical protein WAI453_003040 [Rhynchosporium graminicola]|uniref:Related to 2-methylcitrate dehydratase (PrpD) n=1 Tax=Rhynchosporium graminicola TaxID=2792576 RepID=A0A1E1LJF9_9HELO|nr:related to 2-methylcitrate dehydratase (PrpD) [Rhynchosporium commune]